MPWKPAAPLAASSPSKALETPHLCCQPRSLSCFLSLLSLLGPLLDHSLASLCVLDSIPAGFATPARSDDQTHTPTLDAPPLPSAHTNDSGRQSLPRARGKPSYTSRATSAIATPRTVSHSLVGEPPSVCYVLLQLWALRRRKWAGQRATCYVTRLNRLHLRLPRLSRCRCDGCPTRLREHNTLARSVVRKRAEATETPALRLMWSSATSHPPLDASRKRDASTCFALHSSLWLATLHIAVTPMLMLGTVPVSSTILLAVVDPTTRRPVASLPGGSTSPCHHRVTGRRTQSHLIQPPGLL